MYQEFGVKCTPGKIYQARAYRLCSMLALEKKGGCNFLRGGHDIDIKGNHINAFLFIRKWSVRQTIDRLKPSESLSTSSKKLRKLKIMSLSKIELYTSEH